METEMATCAHCRNTVNKAWAVEENFCSTYCFVHHQAWSVGTDLQEQAVRSMLVKAGKVF